LARTGRLSKLSEENNSMKHSVKVLAALVLGTAASAQTFDITLDGAQEVPPVATPGTGTATVTIDVATGAVQVDGTYQNLSSGATAAHIHGPAPVGGSAGILIGLAVTGGTSGTFFGGGTLSPAEVTDFLGGLHYLNVHTTLFSAGEIRGQIVAPGSATPYGGNPPGSLSLIGGAVKINTTLTLGVDNPLGTQAVGSLPFLGLALGADPSFVLTGTGTPVPGWGMSGPTGEILISVAAPNPIIVLPGPAWAGAGNPAPITIPIPNQLPLVGVDIFAQAVLIDAFGTPTFGLTNGMLLDIGL
jgi:hypothetical protein